MRRKLLVVSLTVLAVVSFSLLYALMPASVVEKPQISQKSVIVSGFPADYYQRPIFSNVSIPSNALSVTVDISMSVTNFDNGTPVQPSSVIVGLFSGNATSWGIQKAGYYQPSLGYYEIRVSPLSYSIKTPVINPNGTLNLTSYTYDNFTFRGKTFSVGVDVSLNYLVELCSIHWVEMKYTYARF